MIAAPYPVVEAAGPLAPPNEQELAAAWPALADDAPTLSWAAVSLGRQPAALEALARAGELVVIPGPWRLRQGYGVGLGCVVPTWQLAGGRIHPDVPALVQAAATAGWTSLDLHRFMTAPAGADGETPARLLRGPDGGERVLVLVRGVEPSGRHAQP